MIRGRGGSVAEELTDRENRRQLGTLTARTWRGLTVEEVAAKWWSLDVSDEHFERLAALDGPLEDLVEVARESSGAIKGEHRKDVTQALVGAPQLQNLGLSVPVATGDGNGGRSEPVAASGRRRSE